jgi:putative thioredoxin
MDVTVESFEQEVLERSHELPVVVDFWAGWCGPCRMLGPVLEREAEARQTELVLAKVDVDAHPELALRYQVQGIPAVKAFRNGHVVGEFVGALPPAAVASFLDQLTAAPASERIADELEQAEQLPNVVGALRRGDHELALEGLLDAIPGAPTELRERFVEAAVALFGELGQDHPISARFRRRLAVSLF